MKSSKGTGLKKSIPNSKVIWGMKKKKNVISPNLEMRRREDKDRAATKAPAQEAGVCQERHSLCHPGPALCQPIG